jgi:hypothetical protein
VKVAHSILVALAALALSSSFTVPVEGLPETAYDESEAVPYESISFFSITQRRSIPVPHSALRAEFLYGHRRTMLAEPSQPVQPTVGASIRILNHSLRC